MTGWEQNEHDGAFTAAPVDEAGARLAAILDEEDADVVVGYDWHGGYGHPDHIAVHRTVRRAALKSRRASTPTSGVHDEPRCDARIPGRDEGSGHGRG